MLRSPLAAAAVVAALAAPAAAPGQTADAPAAGPRTVGSLNVDAHTDAPLRVTRTVHLNAPPDRVFATLERYELMPKWFPAVTSVTCDRSTSGGVNGVGTVRVCQMAAGPTLTEDIVGREQDALLAYAVRSPNPMGVEAHLAVVTVAPAGDGTLLIWRQYFDHPNAAEFAPQVDAMLAGGFDGLVGGFGGGDSGSDVGVSPAVLTRTFAVDAAPAATWAALRDLGGVHRWCSVVSDSSLSAGADGGTRRVCQTPMGTLREAVTSYDEAGRTLAYTVESGLPPTVAGASNHWAVTAAEGGTSRVTMTMRVTPADGLPAGAAVGVREMFSGMADAVTEEFAHYAATGRPHPRKAAAAAGSATR